MERDEIVGVLAEHRVRFALLFGSHARGDATSDSDVDVAVMPSSDTDIWMLRGALGETVDLVDLSSAPDYLVGRISLEGEVLLETDAAERVRWQADHRKRHLDEQFRRDQFRRDFVRAHG